MGTEIACGVKEGGGLPFVKSSESERQERHGCSQ